MNEHLILRLEGPLQAWGDVAMDPRRPTREFPSRSGLAGLLANALGWRYRDTEATTALQDGLRYAAREDRPPTILRDYQTADLGAIGTQGWTRWGVETRGGANATGNQILEKFYLADGAFTVAVALGNGATQPDGRPISLDDLERALRLPARPLYLGRKSCPPAMPILRPPGTHRVLAETPADALLRVPLSPQDLQRWNKLRPRRMRVWYDPLDGVPVGFAEPDDRFDVWDRRDYRSNRFGGARRMALSLVSPDRLPSGDGGRTAA